MQDNQMLEQGGQKHANELDAALETDSKWDLKCILEDLRRWLKLFMETRGFHIDASRYVYKDGIRQNIANTVRDISLEFNRQVNLANQALEKNDKVPRPSERLIQHAVAAEIDEKWRAYLDEKTMELSFEKTASWQNLENFVKACTGEKRKIDVYILAHWLWQVKRKMKGMGVAHHIMIVFVGKQGAGKSTAVTKLLDPINAYRSDMSISALGDERNFQSLEENFVIVSDEMHGCDKTDVEILKQVISGSTITARRLYTNVREKLNQRTTLIGTSNNSLDILVRDGTGMRRFYELKCSEQMDWNLLNAIDYVSLWKAIDENINDGYLKSVKSELAEVQEEMRSKDQVETYLEESAAAGQKQDVKVPVSKLYQDYHEWASRSGFRPLDKSYFGKRMKHLEMKTWRNNKERYYLVSQEFRWFGSNVPVSEKQNNDEELDALDQIASAEN